MFFYIDESGNTGNNLFDRNQPVLSYGVLSCKTNLDLLASNFHNRILQKTGTTSLHANQLGMEGLRPIADDLIAFFSKFRLHFDYYFIDKRSFAVVTFFNAVFDAGLNEAVKWDWYWTPLRFPLIAALDFIVEEEMLKESWALCLTPNSRMPDAKDRIVKLLGVFLTRLDSSKIDDRRREIIGDALRWGIKNPLQLDFGTYDAKALSPNAVAFQFVIAAIARRKKVTSRDAMKILVDRQTEFNPSQFEAYSLQSRKAEGLRNSPGDRAYYLAHPFMEGVREDAANLISHFPREKLTISNSDQSIGLQITDIALWIANKFIKNSVVPQELRPLVRNIFRSGTIDGISIPAMMNRWKAFERKLPAPDNIPDHLMTLNANLVQEHREKIKELDL